MRDFAHYNWWTERLQGISRIMEGNSSHMQEAPLGICHSGPQFPGHSCCCFGRQTKYSSCVESPRFCKCRSTVSTGKASPGAQSWAKTQIKVTPISLQTTCARHDPATRSPTRHSQVCLKEKTQTSPETTFSEMLQLWSSSPLGVLPLSLTGRILWTSGLLSVPVFA